MRATGKDIQELFGYTPDDCSAAAVAATNGTTCPFVNGICGKTNHDQSETYGVCSLSNGARGTRSTDVIVCPSRLYANNHAVLNDAVRTVWGASAPPLVVGGSIASLRTRALSSGSPQVVIAFGKSSGNEIQVDRMSMDWVLQRYSVAQGTLQPIDFIGIEVQSIDITGNYRDNWAAYIAQRARRPITSVPDSGHGLNWANVHKRLIPQIIRKGNIYQRIPRCKGFVFVVPDIVFREFSRILGTMPSVTAASNSVVSVLTYSLDPNIPASGNLRNLIRTSSTHYDLTSIKNAFINHTSPTAPTELDNSLLNII